MPTLYTALKMRHGPKDRTPRAAGPVTGFAVNRPRLLSESFEQRPAASVGKRVIVVGAGFAGLAAAYEMFRLGYDVMILEARKRLGGRVFSLNDVVSGKNVEGGGELIGSNHPTWLSYRDHFNLNFLHVHDGISSPIVLQGKRLTERESRKLSKDIDLATDEINTEARKLVNQFQPWTQPKALDLDKLSLGMRIRQLGVSRRCKIALAAQFSNDNGVSCDNQSYLGVLAMIKGGGVEHFWNETEVYRCEGGNQQLAIKLAHPFDDQHLKLNSPVKEINIGESSASVLLHSRDRLSADDVILAVPPSVWDSIVFDPALPLSLRPKPQMGKNVKFIISLNEEFWIGTGISPDMSSDGPIGQTWHSTQEQSGNGAALVAFSGSDRA